MIEIRFGYWPCKWELDVDDARIRPVPDYDSTVEMMRESGRVVGKWFYPPFTRAYDSKPTLDPRPEVYESVYGIKATHFLTVPDGAAATRCAEFVVALLGLLEGLRLIPETWVHFYRAAIERHSLSDLMCNRPELETVLQRALGVWRRSHAAVQRLLFGAIHWESYTHEFERFNGQYIVLDTCFRLHCYIHGEPTKNDSSHARRPIFLAGKYGIPLPSWGEIGLDGKCELSKLRNEFFHEGLYGGEPIAFAHPKFDVPIDLQLANFNTRLILAILGIRSGYVRSPVGTRCMHGLGLEDKPDATKPAFPS